MRRSFLFLLFLLSLPTLALAVTAEEYYQTALTLYKAKDYEQAFKYYEAATQVDPKHWKAYQSMGHCRFRQDRPGEALYFYEKSLALKPDNEALKKVADSLLASGVTAPAPTPPPLESTTPVTSQPTPGTIAPQRAAESKAPVFKAGLSWGPKAGLNWTKPNGDWLADSKSGMGWTAGVAGDWKLMSGLAFHPELMVTSRKFDWFATDVTNVPYSGGYVETTYRTEAAFESLRGELPLLAKILLQGYPRISILAGPVPGMTFAVKQKGSFKTIVKDVPDFGAIQTTIDVMDLDSTLPATEFTAGATAGLEIAHGGLSVEIRYQKDLMGDLKQDTLTAMAGYSF